MNNLSWFIYLTQVVDGIRGFMQVTSGLCLFAIAGMGIPALIGKFDKFVGDGSLYTLWKPYAKAGIPLALVAILISNMIPDRRTMLLIAGSEIGDRAFNSQQVREVVDPGLDLLKTWIKRETDRLSKDDAK